MPWPNVNLGNKSLYSLSGWTLIAAWLTLCVFSSPASAVNSGIGATVCSSDVPSAEIQITQPLNDSVLGDGSAVFRGTVKNATQIEVLVNGSYNTTLAIGPTQTSFETTIALVEGTNTVEMTANAICGGQDAQDSVVVTYVPETPPSNGGETPTEVDGEDDGGTVNGPTNSEPEPGSTFVGRLKQLPIVGSAIGTVSDFVEVTGIANTVRGESVAVGALRVGMTITALTAVVLAGSLAPLVLQGFPSLAKVFHTSSVNPSHRSRLYTAWVLRAGAMFIIAVVYFI